MRECARVGLNQWVQDGSGSPIQAWAVGLCVIGTDFYGLGREWEKYLVLCRALLRKQRDELCLGKLVDN